MTLKPRLAYIDQLVGPTSLDIINALTDYYEVHLYTGGIIKTYATLAPSVILHRRPAYSKKGFLARFTTWIFFYLATLPSVVMLRGKEVLFLVSNPPLNFWVGYLFCRWANVRFHLLLWDIYPDIVIQSNYIRANSWLAERWRHLNRKSFPRAARIFTVSENLAREIKKYEPDGAANVSIVPNWVNSDEIKPVDRGENLFLKRQNLTGYFIVMYSGNMGKTHDLETIVEAARLLRDHEKIRFLLIGDGEKKTKIVGMVDSYRLRNVDILPFQLPDLFKHSIAAADIGFVTLSDGFENFSVPSKTYYLMAAGAIVFAVARQGSELENLVSKYACGYRFEPGSALEIANRIVEVFENKDLFNTLRSNARAGASHFTQANAHEIAHEVAHAK